MYPEMLEPVPADSAASHPDARLHHRGKSVVAMLSFTSGLFNPAVVCSDPALMIDYNRAAMLAYYQNGIAGITVYTRGTLLSAPGTSTADQCYVYTPADTGMVQFVSGSVGLA